MLTLSLNPALSRARKLNRIVHCVGWTLALFIFAPSARAQDNLDPLSSNRASELAAKLPPWPNLSIPETDDVNELIAFVDRAKSLQPVSAEQFLQMQTAIRQTSRKVLEAVTDRESEVFQNAEFDFISSSVNLLANQGEKAQIKTFETFRDYLEEKPRLSINDLKMTLIAAQNLEQFAKTDNAIVADETFAKIIGKKENAAHQMFVDVLESNVRRLQLPGTEIEVSGTTVTGEKFDIKELRGKFVLVNVWATFAPPVAAEYPYLRELYENYRDQGFEIVGICLDTKRDTMMKFIRDAEVPWINLWEEGGQHPFIQKYGISAIPTMILVDREGKVATIEARGVILGTALANLFSKDSDAEANTASPPKPPAGAGKN
jgi:thiol-disulfide isomerase/thioredoxin